MKPFAFVSALAGLFFVYKILDEIETLSSGGYQPKPKIKRKRRAPQGNLDTSNPPRGGSGVPPLRSDRRQKS